MDELSFWLECPPQPKKSRSSNRSGPRHLRAPGDVERRNVLRAPHGATRLVRYLEPMAYDARHRPEHMAPSRLSQMPASLMSRLSDIQLPQMPALPTVRQPALVAGSVAALLAAGSFAAISQTQSDAPEPITTYAAGSVRTIDTDPSRSAQRVFSPKPSPAVTTTSAAPTTTVAPTTTSTTAAPKPAPTTAAPKPVAKNSASGGASFYDYKAGGCAHRTLPKGTTVTVTNTANNRSTTCVVNDRGPFIAGRIIDLERGVFKNIASTSTGVINVKIGW